MFAFRAPDVNRTECLRREEEELRQPHELRGNVIVDLQFRRQRYCFSLVLTRRHGKVRYLPKSRNLTNSGQTDLQKNAFFFIFFATPSGLSSFFAFWGLSFGVRSTHVLVCFGGFLFIRCSLRSRLVVTAVCRVCFLSFRCWLWACGVGRLPRRCPLST